MKKRRPKSERRLRLEADILTVTRHESKTLSDIATALSMPKNTLRSKYLYPMVAEGLLTRKDRAYKAAGA